MCVENGNLTLQCPCRNRLGDPRMARRRPRRVHLWHYTGMTHSGDALAKFVLVAGTGTGCSTPAIEHRAHGLLASVLRCDSGPHRGGSPAPCLPRNICSARPPTSWRLCGHRGASVRRASATSWEDACTRHHCHRCCGDDRDRAWTACLTERPPPAALYSERAKVYSHMDPNGIYRSHGTVIHTNR